MDELRRIIGGSNCKYIDQMKGRWAEFCSKVQFYGIWKKVLKPPLPLDVRGGKWPFHTLNPHIRYVRIALLRYFSLFTVDFTVTLFNALPSLFPSKTTPPKRLGSASEALLHILKVRTAAIPATVTCTPFTCIVIINIIILLFLLNKSRSKFNSAGIKLLLIQDFLIVIQNLLQRGSTEQKHIAVRIQVEAVK